MNGKCVALPDKLSSCLMYLEWQSQVFESLFALEYVLANYLRN